MLEKTKEEKIRELQDSVREHHRKLETDSEYRKKFEASEAAFNEVFGWWITKYRHDS